MSSLRRHPTHGAPLRFEKKSYGVCDLCDGAIIGKSKVYQCEACRSCIHTRCVDAPATINHPFHPHHPLSLVHRSRPCSAASDSLPLDNGTSRYVCSDCGYHVDLDWALCSLPGEGPVPPQPLEGKEEDLGMAHLHPLTPFSAKWGCKYCSVCHFPIEGYGHVCLSPGCEFIAHGGCLRYLRYNDGTWVSQVKHEHQLSTLDWKKTTRQRACNFCKLPIEGEYIGCRRCRLFYHRICTNASGTLEDPVNPDIHLTLFVASSEHQEACRSCDCPLGGCLAYADEGKGLYLHKECALRTLDYCKNGESGKISSCLHEHEMFLCHRTAEKDVCSACEDKVTGLAYRCGHQGCSWLLHKSCSVMEQEIHPFHSKHPITLVRENANFQHKCDACNEDIGGFYFSCTVCTFYMDLKCALRRPTREPLKHPLHEHELTFFDRISNPVCYVCKTSDEASIFRCVPCSFDIHQNCLDLPATVEHRHHRHPLTLREFYVGDDNGEYYCYFCETRRDSRLGVYVCERCPEPWTFHIECALTDIFKGDDDIRYDHMLARLDKLLEVTSTKVVDTETKIQELKEQHVKLSERLFELRKERERVRSRSLGKWDYLYEED